MESADALFFIGFAVGLCFLLIFAWLFMIVGTAAIAIHRKQNVREAIQPLLDEF
ncbi:hypothetical protein SAMN02745753_03486 [Marinomonas polaris DSM 16579]|uniref:Uncharacterized protein n=1 Tax=Marinomonas polaris DSM 16579 TaxID=1122206 RepID=A0A1M5I295_9GAMM|nr:hypothetical protein [Marinomonas polaris]SHG22436.1 hypothetical protein SAMN02745753_03486 [Marinomonas polaris DSM 16579]